MKVIKKLETLLRRSGHSITHRKLLVCHFDKLVRVLSCEIRKINLTDAWVALSFEDPTLGFGQVMVCLTVCQLEEPCVQLCVESAWGSLSPCPSPLVRSLARALCLSQTQNKWVGFKKRKKNEFNFSHRNIWIYYPQIFEYILSYKLDIFELNIFYPIHFSKLFILLH